MQDSLPAAGPALPGGIGYPQGSTAKGFTVVTILLSRASSRDVGSLFNEKRTDTNNPGSRTSDSGKGGHEAVEDAVGVRVEPG